MSAILQSIVLTVAVLLWLQVVSADYTASCQQESLDGYYLVATCSMINKTQQQTAISLDNCIANYGGNLACAADGDFSGSCDVSSCILFQEGEYMQCSCGNGLGNQTSSVVNLGSCISNNNGDLTC